MIPDVITFRALYWNVEASAYQAVPSTWYQLLGCTKEWWQISCDPESWYIVTTGATDPSGYFYFLGCEASGVEEYQRILKLADGQNQFEVVGTEQAQWGSVAADCGGSFDMVLPSGHSRVFVNMQKAIEGAYSLFGVRRSYIGVNISTGSNTFYDPEDDAITIGADDIWGDRGIFVAAHEHGHAFHEDALWGNAGAVCTPHYLDTESSLQCAFSEGFADYYAATVRPDIIGAYVYRSYMENDQGFPGCVYRYPSDDKCVGESHEGSVIESAYAAFLYDLTDTQVETHDSIAAPGSYVRELIRTCQVVYVGGGLRRANGPDEVSYCAENTITPGSYFTRRGSYPASYWESAAEGGGWTSSRVRSSWVWNMYEQP